MGPGLKHRPLQAARPSHPHTIKSHVNRIFAKTGSADRAAAIRYAFEHGLE